MLLQIHHKNDCDRLAQQSTKKENKHNPRIPQETPLFNGLQTKKYFHLVYVLFTAYELTYELKKYVLTMGALTPKLRFMAKKIFDLEPKLRYQELKYLIIEETKRPENQRLQPLNGTEIGVGPLTTSNFSIS